MAAEASLESDPVHDARADRHARVLPALTTAGFERVPMPPPLHAALEAWTRQHADAARPEEGVGSVVRTAARRAPSDLVRLDHESALARRVLAEMQPLVEAWCGELLEATSIYGVRVYRAGATLRRHVDHVETHVASAVLLVAQAVDRPWPLVLEDADGRRHDVVLEPGQALLYEGARLAHSRDRPLEGRAYAALFIHYRPRWWSYTPERVEALDRRPRRPSLAYGRPDAIAPPAAAKHGYLAFQPDYGGWNNILMQLEVMVGLAWLTGRTLILPPAKRHYLLGDAAHDLGAFLDLELLGRHLPVLSAEAFGEQIGVDAVVTDFEAFSAWMAEHGHAPGWNALDDLLLHPQDARATRPALAARIGSRRPVSVEGLARERLLYFPMTAEHRMFGVADTFFLLGDATLERRLRVLLRDAIRYRPELVALAERALRAPALGRWFGALHVRRGDFQYPETQIEAAQILAHVRGLFEPGQTLYLATDHDDLAFFDALRAVFHVVTFADLGVEADTPPHATGIVETLVCAGAPGPFAGTRLSTFSSRIATLRGHLAEGGAGQTAALDARIYYTQPPPDASGAAARPYAGPGDDRGETARPWWQAMQTVPLWGRAYEDTWAGLDDRPVEASDE